MFKLNLHGAILALTTSLDYVGVDEMQHGKRVGHMACLIAQTLGWSEARCRHVLHAGMLHDYGVSHVRERRDLNDSLGWDGAEAHCERGASYLAACPALSGFSEVVRYHHSNWNELAGVEGLAPDAALEANLICLADRVDVLLAPHLSGGHLHNAIIWERHHIVTRLMTLSGHCFAPGLVDAFARAAASEAFWLSMEPGYLDEELSSRCRNGRPVMVTTQALREVAELMARVIDAKSHYTDDHSRRVAAISRHLAASMGRRGDDLVMIEIAGLLHDVGKLRVPEDIIDKPGALTREEHAYMARHSYDTYRILMQVFPQTPIPRWAGAHHENLLGEGYPFKRDASQIELESRIISVADIFQALLQDRPYRPRLTLDEAILCMTSMVVEGRLDGEVLAVLMREREACLRLASSEIPLRPC
jgi:HD-GYP domain-containing protein (c-di-GMP phosphodiesterase class II)